MPKEAGSVLHSLRLLLRHHCGMLAGLIPNICCVMSNRTDPNQAEMLRSAVQCCVASQKVRNGLPSTFEKLSAPGE